MEIRKEDIQQLKALLNDYQKENGTLSVTEDTKNSYCEGCTGVCRNFCTHSCNNYCDGHSSSCWSSR